MMDVTECLALDCEMVEAQNHRGCYSMLARVSVVNEYYACILDTYVRPTAAVTSYRTPITGIVPVNLTHAMDFKDARELVRGMIKGRILIGHALHHDLKALRLCHPEWNTRDTSSFPTFVESYGNRNPSLSWLAQSILGWNIQKGTHCSVTDARATMMIYKKYEEDMDDWMRESDSESEVDSENSDEYDEGSDGYYD